ncbi:hypothetical protein QFW77_06075 [Luteimonas sp. RD2P54]|uniref:PKD domain-containing protein n=1 Tax=Luteimonas endophytica TaxID=3042023 RepID=A0ABT6J6V3_9GAMM|nr:hypothetical protein [Luteimonas endophytica]MDH5822557.1 hypothetical protein [Luteimonas endophytica]
MNRTRPALLVSALLIGSLALAACNRDPEPVAPATPPPAQPVEPATPPEPERPAPTVTVTAVQLGTDTAADRTIAAPATSFSASDDTIVAAVSTSAIGDAAMPSSGTLTARWTFEDGQLVDERSEQLDFTGADVTNFRISNPEDWPQGRYTLEISLDGEVVETREFTIE